MNAKDIKQIAEAALPSIRAALDAAEELAAIRDAATAKGIDWSQLKSLLTAQEKDARDGGESKRVARIVEKADFASAYADMLGLREDERARPEVVHVATPAALAQTMASEGLISQEHADKATVIASAMALRFAGDEEDVPDFLDRRRPRSAALCGN